MELKTKILKNNFDSADGIRGLERRNGIQLQLILPWITQFKNSSKLFRQGYLQGQDSLSSLRPDRVLTFFRTAFSTYNSPIAERSSLTSCSCWVITSRAFIIKLCSPPFTKVSTHACTSLGVRSFCMHGLNGEGNRIHRHRRKGYWHAPRLAEILLVHVRAYGSAIQAQFHGYFAQPKPLLQQLLDLIDLVNLEHVLLPAPCLWYRAFSVKTPHDFSGEF